MVSDESGKLLDAHVATFTVGFVSLKDEMPTPFGSGTLVKTATTQGILTCGHVLAEIEKVDVFGVCLFPVRSNQLQAPKLLVEETANHAISLYDQEGDAPDLAFIPIPTTLFSSLRSTANVFDLDEGAARYKSPSPSAYCIDVVAGVVAEMTAPASEVGSKRVLSVNGLMNVGKVENSAPENGYDMLLFTPQREENSASPTTFGGTSGGGLWEVFVNKNEDGGLDFVQKRLAGVAFYERFDDGMKIKCHGPDSLYTTLLPKIYEQYPLSLKEKGGAPEEV